MKRRIRLEKVTGFFTNFHGDLYFKTMETMEDGNFYKCIDMDTGFFTWIKKTTLVTKNRAYFDKERYCWVIECNDEWRYDL